MFAVETNGPAQLLCLGDSVSCGEGVGVRVDVGQAWTGLLAAGMAVDLGVLARPGATIRQVRETQLAPALAAAPSWVTLFVGLNDIFRSRLDAAAMRADLATMVHCLTSAHKGVLIAKLHDPTGLLPITARLKATIASRVAAVNAAIDELDAPGLVVVDLSAVIALRRREAWAVDRLHPSPFGHATIAAAAATRLADDAPWPRVDVCTVASGPVPTRFAECRWVVRHGMPWVARRVPTVGTAVATLLAG